MSLPTNFFIGRGGGVATVFVEFAIIGGGGGGGDGNAPGGGGGAGGMVEASGSFPLGVTFTLQLGANGRGTQSNDDSGQQGYATRLFDQAGSGSGFDLYAYGGGRGASYNSGAQFGSSVNDLGGSGGGGSGPSNHNYGAGTGVIGRAISTSLVSDLSFSKHAHDGGNYNGSQYQGGGGGGAGGVGSTPSGGSGRNPIGKTSGLSLWHTNMTWGAGGNGAPGGGQTGSISRGYYHLGNGGAGSGDSYGQNNSNGNIGGLILNIPSGTSISITGSNPNMTYNLSNTAPVGGSSYIFYDSNYYFNDGSLSGSFNITLS